MEDLIPEKMEDLIPQETLEEELPIAEQAFRRRVRPEGILALIALLTAGIFICLLVLCLPHIQEDRARLASSLEETIPPLELSQFQTEAAEDPEETMDAEDPEPIVHETQAQEESQEEAEAPTIPPEENPYNRWDFQYSSQNFLLCERQASYPGVDVSAHQGEIDWQQVKDAGIRFAIIRLGYRGYGSGKLVEDEYAKDNLKNAKEAGLPVGAYFFSQALNIKEVDEEIEFLLEVLGDQELDMPIILDWEIPTEDSRTAGMDGRTLTDMQLHFCETMKEKGFVPMVYFNWHMSRNLLRLNELEEYPFWLALYQDRMTYPYRVEMWQYTDQGRVPGIGTNVDINVYIPDLRQ